MYVKDIGGRAATQDARRPGRLRATGPNLVAVASGCAGRRRRSPARPPPVPRAMLDLRQREPASSSSPSMKWLMLGFDVRPCEPPFALTGQPSRRRQDPRCRIDGRPPSRGAATLCSRRDHTAVARLAQTVARAVVELSLGAAQVYRQELLCVQLRSSAPHFRGLTTPASAARAIRVLRPVSCSKTVLAGAIAACVCGGSRGTRATLPPSIASSLREIHERAALATRAPTARSEMTKRADPKSARPSCFRPKANQSD